MKPGPKSMRHLGCKFNSCDREHKASGYCEYHYFNYYYPYELKKKKCTECDKLARVKGLCEMHYRRQYRAAGGV